jgi:hypothetical protein
MLRERERSRERKLVYRIGRRKKVTRDKVELGRDRN